MAYFHGQDKWKNLTKDDLMQGGKDKFFGQVMFSGSHQLSLANLLMGKVDISAVDDIDVSELPGPYAPAPTTRKARSTPSRRAPTLPSIPSPDAQFVIIKSIPVQNTPFEANNAFIDQPTIDKIVAALVADKVTNDPMIFQPKGASGAGLFAQPHRFVKVDDAWYDPMRKVLGIQ